MAEDRSVLIKTAYAYYQRGDWDRALEEYHKLVELDPGDLNVLNILADIYAKKGDVKEAFRQYDLVAQGYDQKNQVDKVLQVYKRMVKLAPANLELQTAVKNLIQKYLDRAAQLEESDPDRVIEIYRSILKAEPNRFDATVRMSKALVRKQQKFQAVELLLNLAETLDPATQTGRLLESLQLVVEIDPVNVEARDKLSKYLIAAKENALAIENLRALMEIYISRNDLEHARETAQRAIDLGDVEAYYHLGVIHFNQERFGESLQCFRRFLQKQETHVGALKYLALCHLKLNQHPEAVQAYLRILSVYVNENLLEEAREVRQTILELDPTNEAIKSITLDASVPGNPAQSVSGPETAAPAPTAPVTTAPAVTPEQEQQAFLEHAQEFVEKGLYDQAIDLYLEMIKRWPAWMEIKARLQQVYALMVKPAEPAVKAPSAEEMKADLERELRAQMKAELENQARRLMEEQAKMQAERLLEIERIKQEQEGERRRLQKELEEKMLEQLRKSNEDAEERERLRKEFEERQRSIAQDLEKYEREKEESVRLLREQVERAQREKDASVNMLREEMERSQKDKDASVEKLRAEMERSQREKDEAAAKLREEMERAQREKLESVEKLRAEVERTQREKEESAAKLREEMERAQRERTEVAAKLQEELDRSQKEKDASLEQFRAEMERSQREKDESVEKLRAEMERVQREKEQSSVKLREEMERSQKELEERLRSQLEKELRDKIERETRDKETREREQRERDQKVKDLMRQEEEERRRYEEEKNRQKAEASLQDEIFSRMERLRSEKEREPQAPPAPQSPTQAPSNFLQEVQQPLAAQPASGPELALNDPFVRQTLADIYAKQGLFVEAVKIYEKILNEDPNNDEVREKLREILRLKGF